MNIFKKRREKLLQKLPKNSAVILSTNPVQKRNHDVDFTFRPDSNFYYLTGFQEPNAVIVLSSEQYIMFLRDKDKKCEIWNGKRLGVKQAKPQLNLDKAFDINDINNKLLNLLKDYDKIFFDFANLTTNLVDIITKKPYSSLQEHLADLRVIKDEIEIDNIKNAIQISKEAHILAMKNVKNYQFEYHLASDFAKTFAFNNVQDAYPPIVASGGNATTLHYIENNSKLKNSDLVLIDAGCEYNYYASDITRTFPVNGKFSKPQSQIYQLVLDAQTQAIASIKVGDKIDAPNKIAKQVIKEGLLKLGILQKNHKVEKYFMHSTSHYLGLDVHDAGAYKVNSKLRRFEAGMVVTIEPGIYITDDDKIAKKYHNIGIRIEDNILVTKNGAEVLSANIPKQIKEIEKIML